MPNTSLPEPRSHKTLIIVLLCIAIAVMIAAIFVTVAWNNSGWNSVGLPGSYSERERFTQSAADVEKIIVDMSIENVRVESGRGDDIVITQEATSALKDKDLITTKMDGTTLHVRSGLKNSFHLFETPGRSLVTIIIPAAYDADIAMDVDAGDIHVSGISADEISASTNVGTIDAQNLQCASLHTSSDAGHIETVSVACSELSVSTHVGSMQIAAQVEGKIKLDTDAGDVTLSGSAKEADIATHVGSIQATFDSVGALRADTDSGNINVRILDAKELVSVNCETNVGRIETLLPRGTVIDLDYETSAGSLNTAGAEGLQISSDGIPVHLETDAADIVVGTVS